MARKASKSTRTSPETLSRRERQIMDIVYAGSEVSAREVWQQLPDQPSYATVRTLLRVLLEKGQLKHRVEGRSYMYSARESRDSVARTALQRMLQTFYGGSVEQAVSGLLNLNDSKLDAAELERIEQLIADRKNQTPQD